MYVAKDAFHLFLLKECKMSRGNPFKAVYQVHLLLVEKLYVHSFKVN